MVDQEQKDNTEDMRQKVEARKKEEADKYGDTGSDEQQFTPKHIADCLKANELGDGILYAELQRGRYLYNKSSEEWLSWIGHHWERDIMESCLSAAEDVVDLYLKESGDICGRIGEAHNKDNQESVSKLQKLQRDLLRRVTKLRTARGRKNCLHFAHSNKNSIAIRGEELDSKPWLLACANGVIDLQTGKIRDGLSDDYLLKSSPVDWQGIDCPRELWDKTLSEIFSFNQDLVDFVQRLFGCAIVGRRTEDILAVFSGRGRNGKGLIVDAVSRVMGNLAGPIQSDMLLDQGKYKSSAGPTPDIMMLRGMRIAFASETDEYRRFSTARVKWLTGGDELTGRNPHDKYPTTFTPTHTLILLTNHKPHAPDDDFAFWSRMILVPFPISFTNDEEPSENIRPEDKTLPDKLKAEDPGILAWLVEGCLLWQKCGLDPPPAVLEATKEYQRDEDLLAEFLDEHCLLEDDAEIGATEIYEKFEKWYEDFIGGRRVPKQKKFGQMMTRKFEKRKINGVYRYFGVGLAPIDPAGDDRPDDAHW